MIKGICVGRIVRDALGATGQVVSVCENMAVVRWDAVHNEYNSYCWEYDTMDTEWRFIVDTDDWFDELVVKL